MNYSFILSGNKELTDLKIKLTGKDPINTIKEENCFEKIIKLENGEEMSKMIVGKALKYNEELIQDEKKEISFAKKYQILSKNTALFAEILNDEKQQSELIKVDLAKLNEKSELFDKPMYTGLNNPLIPPPHLYPQNAMHNMKPMTPMNFMGGMSGIDYYLQHSSNIIGAHSLPPRSNFQGMNMPFMGGMNPMMNPMMMQQNQMQMMAMGSSPMMQQNQMQMMAMGSPPMMNCMPSPPNMNCMPSPPINQQNSINNNNIVKKSENSDLNLIMIQDALEGFWDENEETKKIIDIISLDKFNKIKDKIIALNKGEKEKKIIYTILVIYYLKTYLSKKLNEYRLVIHKADKFLKENGIDYNDIISGIN